MSFVVGLVLGVALGMIVIAFLALGAYEHGYQAAMSAPWRHELRDRRAHSAREVSTSAA